MHQNNVFYFYFLKLIFDISTSKNTKKKKTNLKLEKIKKFQKHGPAAILNTHVVKY